MTAYGGRELAAAFRTVRKNTIHIATEIPDDKYKFVPAPGMRTVGQLLAHIVLIPRFQEDVHRVRHLTTVAGYDFFGFNRALAAEEAKLTTKPAILSALQSEGERFAAWLEGLSGEFLAERVENFDRQGSRSRLEMLLSPKEHEMHHRGQLMVAQRLLGLTPHLTREREARAAALAAAKPQG